MKRCSWRRFICKYKVANQKGFAFKKNVGQSDLAGYAQYHLTLENWKNHSKHVVIPQNVDRPSAVGILLLEFLFPFPDHLPTLLSNYFIRSLAWASIFPDYPWPLMYGLLDTAL